MKKTILLAGILFLSGLRVIAQIEGEVLDEQNRPVLTALITVRDSKEKIIASLKPDKKGFYFIDSLAPGKYRVEAKAAGFTNFSKTVEVTTMPKGADPLDDTYFAILVDIIMARPKAPK